MASVLLPTPKTSSAGVAKPVNDSRWSVNESKMKTKIAIIGGGIVGLATAHQLLLRYPEVQLLLLEKESGPGRHQTGNNSGVLHCGLYYKPGSTKARLAVQGIRRMVEFCAQHSVPHDLCGKIVVATREEEIPRLHALMERGAANGLEGLQLWGLSRFVSMNRMPRDWPEFAYRKRGLSTMPRSLPRWSEKSRHGAVRSGFPPRSRNWRREVVGGFTPKAVCTKLAF